MREIIVTIQRFNPETDSKPEFKDYSVPVEGKISLLEALNYIYDNIDGTLAFRSACGTGKCGVCGVRLNGQAVLACRTWLEEGHVLIEPLKGRTVLRDLIVAR